MSLKLNSSGGGSVTLQEPTTASNRTLSLPDATGTVVYADASGNVKTSSDSGFTFGSSANTLYQSAATKATLKVGTAPSYFTFWDNAGVTTIMGYPLAFSGNGATEHARIDTSGNLLVGTTGSGAGVGNTNSGVGVEGSGTVTVSRGDNIAMYVNTNGDRTLISCRRSGNEVGRISVTSTATAYNTNSDYRLKENVQPMTGALAKVAALKPVTYQWKLDGSDGEGFIAHELQAVVPDCVTGEKDAVDADGNPQYQGIDTSFLVATLTAAIQEMKAIIDSQAERIAALEAK